MAKSFRNMLPSYGEAHARIWTVLERILIPAARFDPFALLELVERHTMQ